MDMWTNKDVRAFTSLSSGVGVPVAVMPPRFCPCKRLDLEDPGPHVPACPWADPDYDEGF